MAFNKDLVAPCGMNCGVCMRYLATTRGVAKRMKIPECIGCRPRNKKCSFIKGSCSWLGEKKINFCFECQDFPCIRLERLNRRYTTKYGTSLISNLLEIRGIGLDEWLKKEEKKWKCPLCRGVISVHDRKCYDCGNQGVVQLHRSKKDEDRK